MNAVLACTAHVSVTVQRPLTYAAFWVSTKLRKSGETPNDVRSQLAMGRSVVANTAGPGSLTLCFGWTLTRTKLPTSPGVSAYVLSGSPSRLTATSRASAQLASLQI